MAGRLSMEYTWVVVLGQLHDCNPAPRMHVLARSRTRAPSRLIDKRIRPRCIAIRHSGMRETEPSLKACASTGPFNGTGFSTVDTLHQLSARENDVPLKITMSAETTVRP